MSEIRKILVPVDFSESSQAALDYAASFASRLGASVDVLHVWEIPGLTAPMNMIVEGVSLVDWAQKNAQEALDRFVRDATGRGVSIHSSRTQAGRPPSTIVDIASAEGYDLIIVATHGRTGLARLMLGSVAENVVRHAPCPVLTVRPRTSVEK